MLKRTCLTSFALLGTLVSVGRRRATRLAVLAPLGVLAIAALVLGTAAPSESSFEFPNPTAHGKAASVEQAAGRAARRYLAPLLNKPKVLTKISVGECAPAEPVHSRSVYRRCTVQVDGPTADCRIELLVRLFESGRFYARAASLRCS